MLVWRSCIEGRLWAVLTVVLAFSRAAWGAGDIANDVILRKHTEFRKNSSRPEAIAAIAGLMQNDENLPPGRLARVLREMSEGKLAGKTDPLVLAQVAYLLSLEEDRRGAFAEAETQRKSLALMGDFWVLGPFDGQGRSGLGRVFPVEEERATLDPRGGKRYPGKEREVGWRRVPSEAFVQGSLFLDAILRPDSDAVAYVLCYVNSDSDRWAALRIGSPGPVKAWVGENEVISSDVVRQAWLDQDSAPFYLRRGANLMLVKTVVTQGAWRLFLRVTDPDGRPMPGVSSTAAVLSPMAPMGLGKGRAPKVRDLPKLLRERAERSPKSKAARAWLDYALAESLLKASDSEQRAIEAAANKAVSAVGEKLNPIAVEALSLLGSVAREEDDRRAALERTLSALSRTEERAGALAEIGRLWTRQHRTEEAIAHWRQAIALDPKNVVAQMALAREEQHAGLTAAALTRLSALPEAAKKIPTVQDALADVLGNLGRRGEAESIRRLIYLARRTDVSTLRDLASAARSRGDLAETARLYGEGLRWRPDLILFAYDQATALEGLGDVAAARSILQAVERRLPDDAGVSEELGQLEARAGRFEAARTSMLRSLAIRPQNPGLRRYVDALASAQKAKPEQRSADELVARNAEDGEAVAREALFGKPATDDASAEVLLDRTVVRVHANGLSERFVQRLVHVRTERTARDSQESWVRFEPGRQEVEIRKARILRRGPNRRIDISEATGRDVRDLSEPWYGLYYDTRAAIVYFENLRAGDILELQYTVADVAYGNELADYFGDFEMVADTLPTRQWDYTLIAPTARVFYFNRARLAGLAPRVERQGQETWYRFATRNVPRVDNEPSMPGFAEVAPYLHISTYRSWEDVGRWYWNLVSDQMQDDGTLKKAAVKATTGLTTTLDKVKAIHRLVVESTRYVGLEFGIHGYKPYKSTQVFQRGFGDCKDKATLLMTLLRTIGIDTEVVLLRTRRGGRIDEAPASLAVFDHAIAYVPTLDLYLDGTAEFSGLGELPSEDQDTLALRVSAKGSKLVRTPTLSAEKNRAMRTWKVDLGSDGSARIAEVLTITGQAAHEWRSHYQTPGERRERYAKIWNGRYAGAVLEKVEMEVSDRNRPALTRAWVQVPQLGERRNPSEVQLPTSSREADFTSTYARLGRRHWPLVLSYPWQHEEQVNYQLPTGARLVRAPSARTLTTRFGMFTLTPETTSEGRRISIKSALVVDKNRIEPEEYADFRSFLHDIDALLAERVVVDLGRAP
jgi:tetratricopeptide (TPR) repeat protein